MATSVQATRAYAASAAHRPFREQEAEVFRRVNAAMRGARGAAPTAQARAIADNDRLWCTVIDLVRDPDNALPEALRAQLVSIGLAVRRELRQAAPDFDFLVAINENIADGLAARHPATAR